MIKRLLICFLCLVSASCVKRYPVRLGDDTVVHILQEKNGQGKNFVHVHQNETTALHAAKAVIKSEGGSLLTLRHPGGRNIVFHLQHQRYEFDPNRIFTSVGIKKTLAQYSNYSPAAQAEVEKLAFKIKQLLPSGKVIAVHNNETYSLKDYLPGANLADDARLLYVSKQQYFRNFYLVTQKEDFRRFKQLGFNSIWQDLNVTDDGSLSVLFAKKNYINIEAGYDQLATQIQMCRHA